MILLLAQDSEFYSVSSVLELARIEILRAHVFLVSSSAGLGVPLDLFELLVEAVASSVPCLAEENERVGDDVMSKRKVVDQASS